MTAKLGEEYRPKLIIKDYFEHRFLRIPPVVFKTTWVKWERSVEKPWGVSQCSPPSWGSFMISALRWLNEVLLSFPNNSYTIQGTHIVSKQSVYCLKYIGAIFTTETTHKPKVTLPYREAPLLTPGHPEWVSTNRLTFCQWESDHFLLVPLVSFISPLTEVGPLAQLVSHQLHHPNKAFTPGAPVSYLTFLSPHWYERHQLYISGWGLWGPWGWLLCSLSLCLPWATIFFPLHGSDFIIYPHISSSPLSTCHFHLSSHNFPISVSSFLKNCLSLFVY